MSSPKERAIALKSPNGRLAAMLHETGGSNRIVILAHGFTGSKHEGGRLFVTTARALAAAGMDVVRFDFFGSGDSEGEFNEMSPNTEITDLDAVIKWAAKRYKSVGVLGLSLGGAVSICATAKRPEVKALVTWSSVPSFNIWRKAPEGKIDKTNVMAPGPQMYTDRPAMDVGESYATLRIPKLQIQGDKDLQGFVEGFQEFFPKAPAPKKHIILKDADHVFTTWKDRRKVIQLSVKWFQKYL